MQKLKLGTGTPSPASLRSAPSPAVQERGSRAHNGKAPLPHRAGLSGESVTTGCSKICRGSVALTTRPFTPLPPLTGGRGWGGGGRRAVCGAAHLTLPTLRLDPSLSPLKPLKGGEGLVSAGRILVERDASRAIKFSSPDSPAHRGRGGPSPPGLGG